MNIHEKQNILSIIWPDVDFNTSDNSYTTVKCVFHDDVVASSALKFDSGYFNCLNESCYESKGEVFDGLIEKELIERYFSSYFNIEKKDLPKIITYLKTNGNRIHEAYQLHLNLLDNPKKMEILKLMGISKEVIIETMLGFVPNGSDFCIPIIQNNVLLGYRYYNKNPLPGIAKVWSSTNTPNGLILPIESTLKREFVLICAGEKDMLIARSQGFDAITLNGGEASLPKIKLWEIDKFKNKEFWIVYDNDEQGKLGAIKLGNFLVSQDLKIKNITGFHDNPLQSKEDIFDYFMKYRKTAFDLITLGKHTPYFKYTPTVREKTKRSKYKFGSLEEAANANNFGDFLSADIQVKATFESSKSVPTAYIFKVKSADSWFKIKYQITPNKYEELVGLVQSINDKEKYMRKELLRSAKNKLILDMHNNRELPLIGALLSDLPTGFPIDQKVSRAQQMVDSSKFVSWEEDLSLKSNVTINYLYLIDSKEDKEITNSKEQASHKNHEMGFKAIAVNANLTPSGNYRIEYRPVSDQFNKKEIIIIIDSYIESKNSIALFKETDEVRENLLSFINPHLSVADQLQSQYSNIKNKRINHLQYDLWLITELTFHSQLQFLFKGKITRGTIYSNIIGDTRIGKSELSHELRELYRQGTFVNAKLSTIDSLVGGSVAHGKEYMIQAGVLPNANKSLIILEEVHGLPGYYEKITEVKSSSKVIINRVSGTLNLDCLVRLIEISNPKGKNGKDSKSLRELSSGVEVIKNLIRAPEDIARNDIYLCVKGNKFVRGAMAIDWTKQEKEQFRDRIKWVWSREPNNVVFEDTNYIDEWSVWLNDKFEDGSILVLGNEGPIKIARMAAAVAGMLVSTIPGERSFEKLYVTSSHVEFVAKWLDKIYSSEFMGLDRFVKTQREMSTTTEQDIINLQILYENYSQAIDFLYDNSELSSDQLLLMVSGGQDSKADFTNRLNQSKFFKVSETSTNTKIWIPTIKFRKAYKKMKENKTGAKQYGTIL